MGENTPKIGVLKAGGSVCAKFSCTRGCPHQSFLHGCLGQWIPYNYEADSFHTKKLCSRLSSTEVRFYMENSCFAFLSPHWGA